LNSLKSTSKDCERGNGAMMKTETSIKVDNLAKALREVYLAFKKEGFTDSQAFTLTLTKIKEIEEELNNGKN
jgi:hypothetical protein